MQPFDSPGPPRRLLFGDYELRPDSGELFRAGAPVKLQPQPAKVLEALASRSGEVVTREELRRLAWGDAFLDFDSSLNFCILQIRKALEDSATEPRYVETVPKRGYRFLEPVRIETPSPPDAPDIPALPWPGSRIAGLGAAGLAIVLLILVIGGRRLGPFDSPPRLAVLPLECGSADPADQQVCGGITETLTAELTRRFPRDLEVVAPVSALAYGEKLEKLGATHVLQGTAHVSVQQLRISARLVHGDEVLWKESLATGLDDAPLLYELVVRRVAQELRLPPPPPRPARAARPSGPGHELYLRGIYFLRQGENERAVASLQDAVTLSPAYAPAQASLALARMGSSARGEQDLAVAAASARKALALDPDLAEGHFALGQYLFLTHDWEGAGREYRRALALNPGWSQAHHWYAFYLSFQGFHDEAIAAISRARELDPASILVGADYEWFLYLARRYEESARQARNTLELVTVSQGPLPKTTQAGELWAYYFLIDAARGMKDEKTALEAARARMRINGFGDVARRFRTLPGYWAWRGQRALSQPPSFESAKMAAILGDKNRALADLEQLCRRKGDWLTLSTAVEPAFDPLRPDPRFDRVLDCLGLPRDAPARRGS